MSLYNMLFGKNPASDVILATLGLTQADVGRFRDCGIADGEIYIYTRNGGGNRDCWCENDPECGRETCKHHTIVKEAREQAFMPEKEWPDGKAPGNWFTSKDGVYGCYYLTGKMVPQTYYVCEEPCSASCACPGCIINFRLPAHPCYMRDSDDEYDCTYATVYFRFPQAFADDLKKLDEGQPFEPSKAWTAMLDSLGAVSP